jgi:FAD/FMN-containing dehydrogenase
VFAGVELPDDATPAQRERFQAGQGGALVPRMCVDKRPDELASFAALVQESGQFGQDWGMVFAAALSGSVNRAPTSEDAEEPLQRMVEAIKRGEHGAYIPFDAQGQAVQIG